LNTIEEFVFSLRRYNHLIGFKIDIDVAKKIEEIQLNIIKNIEIMFNEIDLSDLTRFISKLSENGVLQRFIQEVSEVMGEGIEVADADKVLKEALDGNMNIRGARSSLIALQAVSRFFADKYLGTKGEIKRESAFCPICGSESKTMVKEGNRYKMVCHFCGYKWTVSEGIIVCPYCGNKDSFSLGLFTDKERRVGLVYCQNCGTSWRIVLDETIKAPTITLPLIAIGAEKFRGSLPNAIDSDVDNA